ncbi:iron uptake porin [Myxacorys almedinensis]|uniref:Iron uptake porin n=1 Tax=Myxacorys almedinensis A TaxID=2690445 RepID=A0A8J7Z277_9CYAN|nr:iron uptake porin [Myxacorys almedinensis]NDJ18309.1 iron uptake porin [Myxacorys almedinensis A]
MSNRFYSILWLQPLLLAAASLTVVSGAQASEVASVSKSVESASTGKVVAQHMAADETLANETPAVADLSTNKPSMGQVTSVSQLSDVRPTDWAFQALQSLVERYGCIAGYPDRTYRGNRALTRYEFAAGLNACLDRVNELIAASTADLVKKEDLATLQKLQEEFAAELATLRGRVDALEARTTTLERQQFSTTTKLTGEVIFGVAGVASGRNFTNQATGTTDRVSRNTIFGDRVRLNLETSFTGRDLLVTRLQAENISELPANLNGDPLTRQGNFRFAGGGSNEVGVDALLYQFPLGERTTISIEANAGAIDDFVDTLNPYLDGDGATGALTHFGTRNSIYYLLGGKGLGVQHQFSDALELSLGYLAGDDTASNPAAGNGLFNGPYGAIAQLTFKPSPALGLGFTYIHAYNNDFTAEGSVGSDRANFRNLAGAGILGADVPTSANAYGISATFQVSPRLVLNGNVGYTTARSLAAGARGDLDIWNWAVGLAVPDFGKKGSVAGVIVGREPTVKGGSGNFRNLVGRDRDSSLHIEGFYQYQLNDNISITPGIVWLTNPGNNQNNDDIVIGTIRTTFTF